MKGMLFVTYLWIAIGGALGTVARFACTRLAAAWLGEAFPWGTLIINVLGSFVIGAFAVLTGPQGKVAASLDARQFVIVGLCGGYTTFSSFSLQTLALAQKGDVNGAMLNIAASVAFCLAAVWLGSAAANAFNALRG